MARPVLAAAPVRMSGVGFLPLLKGEAYTPGDTGREQKEAPDRAGGGLKAGKGGR